MDECGWEMAAASGRSGDGGEGGASVSITLAVLFVMVVLAEVLLVSGLLHVLRMLFLKTRSDLGGGATGGRPADKGGDMRGG